MMSAASSRPTVIRFAIFWSPIISLTWSMPSRRTRRSLSASRSRIRLRRPGSRSARSFVSMSAPKIGAWLPHPRYVLRGLVAAPLADGEEQLQQDVLKARRDARHHAEVDEREPAVRRDEQVAGVRVGVEEAVDEDLMEIGREED